MHQARIFAAAILALAATACASSLDRQQAQMSSADIAAEGLECRREKPMGSIRPQSICATPEAWAAYDNKTTEDSGRLLDQVNSQPNGGFSGN